MTHHPQDRRIKTRYEAQCLEVQLRERGFLGRSKLPVAVTCLDMNRYGMAVLSPRPIEPGTRLFLDFSGKYISESSVAARVVEICPYQTGFRLGIQFSYLHEKRGYSRAVDNALSRIEGFYNRLAG
ncbi:MAG: PilZ domain-containing protein [Marinobacter sp.]|uniref:PilZ domain-containing protein n=1 Tax=Marinobacter sp. TaxID=50741 RepID=UPI00299D4B45|nr:PilZ domain-containing protein [Marinobacter sp.]MDX1634417.1 PilZ domain-containing protein [Marinobacter sp.]